MRTHFLCPDRCMKQFLPNASFLEMFLPLLWMFSLTKCSADCNEFSTVKESLLKWCFIGCCRISQALAIAYDRLFEEIALMGSWAHAVFLGGEKMLHISCELLLNSCWLLGFPQLRGALENFFQVKVNSSSLFSSFISFPVLNLSIVQGPSVVYSSWGRGEGRERWSMK